MDKLIITPKTKVAELLNAYPELDAPLIEMAPAFSKLKNPILRKTIAKITSLEAAALVAEIGVDTIVNKLRTLAGQDDMHDLHPTSIMPTEKPEWMNSEKIIKINDAREGIANGNHPLGEVLSFIPGMQSGDIYQLVTPFYPAPLIEKAGEAGCRAWSEKVSADQFNNFLCKI